MSNLTRWDPFREMLSLRQMMDRMLENSLIQSETDWPSTGWGLALDVLEDADQYTVKASLPGINPDDLEITYNNGVLTIKGELKEEQTEEKARYHLRERRYGKFLRSLSLPAKVQSDKIEAHYEAGILSLALPKVEEVKPKRIAIQTGGSPQLVEGHFDPAKSKN